MKITSLALAVSLALAGSLSAQTKDAALEKLAADWTAAFAKADVKALGALYTDHAIRVTPQGKSLGREAIEKEFTANFAGPWKGSKISIKIGTTSAVTKDVSVNEGTFEVSGITGADGKPAPNVDGSYVNTIVKKNGAWLIASNTAVASAAPAAK